MSGDRRTSAKPITIDGVTFECWKTGIMSTAWKSQDAAAVIYRPAHKSTYTAIVNGDAIGRRYFGINGAMKAAVKAMKALPAPTGGQ